MDDISRRRVLTDDRTNVEGSLNPAPTTFKELRLPAGSPQSGTATAPIRFDRFVLDLQRGSLLSGSTEIPLRPKTFELLQYLASNPGRLVPKEELINAVWPTVVVTDDSLFQCIAEVRRALNDDSQRFVKTVQRRGYRFDADVLADPATPIAPGPGAAFSAPPVTGSAVLTDTRRRIVHVVVAAAVAIGAGAAVTYATRTWWPSEGSRPAAMPPLSLVVLPFRNLTDDRDQEYFAAGVSIDLTTDLSRLPGLVVIAPGTARTLKAEAVDAKALGRELNVRYLVEGSVARSVDQVRINVQLLDTATGSYVWAERFARARDELPVQRDEIVAGIASALNFKLTRLESERTLRERPFNPEAHDLATRGWALLYTAKKRENYETARELFRNALARYPEATHALAGMGWVCALSVLNGWSTSPSEDLAQAKSAADRLLAMDPDQVAGHYVRGVWLRLQRRTDAARDAFQTVITLNPNFAPAYAQLGMVQLELGQPEETIRSVERATRLSPRDPNVGHWIAFIGMAELHRGRYPEAVTWLARSHNVGTASATVLQHAYLVSALELAGRSADAQTALAEFRKAKPYVSITSLRKNARSTNPGFLAQQQQLYDGLRRAGLPE